MVVARFGRCWKLQLNLESESVRKKKRFSQLSPQRNEALHYYRVRQQILDQPPLRLRRTHCANKYGKHAIRRTMGPIIIRGMSREQKGNLKAAVSPSTDIKPTVSVKPAVWRQRDNKQQITEEFQAEPLCSVLFINAPFSTGVAATFYDKQRSKVHTVQTNLL